MKKLILGTAFAALIAVPALAADMPMKSPPMPAPVAAPSWTGFYIGLHGGAGWGSSQTSFTDPNGVISPISLDSDNTKIGAVGGIQLGYNWQFAPTWVAGLEGDFSLASIPNKVPTPVAFGGVVTP